MDLSVNPTVNVNTNNIMDLSINTKRKRQLLSVEDKVKVILQIEKGRRKSDLCREYGIKSSTLSTIWTNRLKYLEAFEHLGKSGSKFKRLRKPDKLDIDEALLKWFKQQRNENIAVTGPILIRKAEHFAKLLGHEHFVCNNGWIDRFKLRHDISFPKVKEQQEHQNQQINDWLQVVWPKFRDGFEDKDIFNADEIGLLYKLTPIDAINMKGEKCEDGKLANDRLTILVCVNADGTEKRKLTVIGNLQTSNIMRLPVKYTSHNKSWITQEIFQIELREWNKELRLQNRRILLLLDNDISHTSVPNLSNIKLVFLPANTSSVVQPMEQGIIRNLKFHYRKLILLGMIEAIENKLEFSYSPLDAIENLDKAWDRVTEAQIRHSFNKSGFTNMKTHENVDNVEELTLSSFLQSVNDTKLLFYDVDLYISFDDNLVTSETQTEQEIVQEVINKNDHHISHEEDETEEIIVPTIAEARQAARIITRFYDSQEVDPMIILQATNIENDLEKRYWTQVEIKQEKLEETSEKEESKTKADKNRQRVEEAFLKSTHVARAEAAAARREERRRAEKERVLAEADPERQRRWEEKEQKRQLKKKAPKMKQLKVKAL